MSEGNPERHPDASPHASANAAHYSAKESAYKGLKSLVGTDDRPPVPRHDADLQPPLLLGRAPMQAPSKRADVARITNRALDHEGQYLEVFRAHFLGNLDLADDARRRTDQYVLLWGAECKRLRASRRSSRDTGRRLRARASGAQSELRLRPRDIALRNSDIGCGLANVAEPVTAGERAPVLDCRRTE